MTYTLKNTKTTKSQDKFFKGNKDIFLQYFDSEMHYDALIRAANFEKMNQVIKENTNGLERVIKFVRG